MTDAAPKDVDERLKLRAEIAQLRETNLRLLEDIELLRHRLNKAQTATISADTADKLAVWLKERLIS